MKAGASRVLCKARFLLKASVVTVRALVYTVFDRTRWSAQDLFGSEQSYESGISRTGYLHTARADQ